MRWLNWALSIPGVFALVVLSFVTTAAITQWKMRSMDHAAMAIADVSVPSIEALGIARGELRNLQHLLREEPDEVGAVDQARRTTDQALDDYLVLPMIPAEPSSRRDLLRTRGAFDDAAARFEPHGEDTAARAHISTAAGDLIAAITRLTRIHNAHSHDLALEIHRMRRDAAYTALGLDVLCTLIAITGAILLRRKLRVHAELVERHRSLLEERASELEQFGGRVAHDILSPLGTVLFALQLATLEADPVKRARVAERGVASIERVKRLVHGLLGFARAGARPDAAGRASLEEVLADLAAELTPTAEAVGAKLTVTGESSSVVRCDPGVLTSLVGNLARNAIKYIGDGPERHIQIRSHERGDVVRVEVKDNGPGLPAELEAQVFEPYARARGSTQPGIGLGLATVKRLAEAHGGRVGVRSVPGRGCTFWFELPTCPTEDTLPETALHEATTA